jgi:hypothetical protein
MRRTYKVAFPFFLILLNLAVPGGGQQPGYPGSLACAAGLFTPLNDSYVKTVVISPDRAKHIHPNQNGSFGVFVGQKQIRRLKYDAEADVEIGWSPDSTQFFITYSDSGAAGGYHAHLFRISEKQQLIESNLPQIAFKDFKSQHYCTPRGDNLYFVGWSLDSRQAFMVAEVYPTSDCGQEMGIAAGYLMDVVSRTIIRRYSKEEAIAVRKACVASGIVESTP